MKNTVKLISLILTLALVLSFAACSNAPKIAGTWSYTIDLKQALEASGELGTASEELGSEDVQALHELLSELVDGVSLSMVLDLKKDGTYTSRIDETSAQAASDAVQGRLNELLPGFFSTMFGVPVEELDDALRPLGTSLEDLQKSMVNENSLFNTGELVNRFAEEGGKGTYRYEDGKLFLTEDGKTEDPAQYLAVELGDNEFKVTAVNGVKSFQELEKLVPLVFTR